MCGLSGYNLHPSSRVNARRLAHELLSGIEYRGSHASGFAAFDRKGKLHIHKDALPGSQLPLAQLPRNSRNVILHTRFATQGDVSDNRNNHPVVSGTGKTVLVHNGVIMNDEDFRSGRPYKVIGEVDSAVIPNIIEHDGLEGLKEMEGYAAVAFVQQGDAQAQHILRLDSSPVAYTWLEDGSFVWASTPAILESALLSAGLHYGHVFTLPEKVGISINRGVITDWFKVEMSSSYEAYMRFSRATSGGHGTSTNYERPAIGGIGSSFYDWDDEEWDDRADAAIAGGTPMGLEPETNGPADGQVEHEGFYLTRDDGSTEFYKDLEELEKELDWLSNLNMYDGAPFTDVEHKLKWTNFVTDMGEVRNSQPVSWLEDLAEIDKWENNRAVYNLEYIREGAGNIIMARGA